MLYEAPGYRSINETIEPLKDILNVYKNLLTEKQASLIENKNNAKNSIGSKICKITSFSAEHIANNVDSIICKIH